MINFLSLCDCACILLTKQIIFKSEHTIIISWTEIKIKTIKQLTEKAYPHWFVYNGNIISSYKIAFDICKEIKAPRMKMNKSYIDCDMHWTREQ